MRPKNISAFCWGATHHWVPWRKSAWMRLIVKWGGWKTLKLSPGPVASQASLLRIRKAYKSIFLGSLHTCRLTLHMLVSRNFVQKWRTAPKANSDDFSPPGSQEPCLHQRLNTGPSEVISFKFLYIRTGRHLDSCLFFLDFLNIRWTLDKLQQNKIH